MSNNIKVIELNGNKSGKTLVILAGVHGNEVCGVNAFDKLIPNLKIESGKVFFIYANLEAIKQNKRFVEMNLNRCFLKEQSEEMENSIEGRTAREIMPYLEKADAMLDIHASFTEGSIPFVICKESQVNDASIFDSSIVSYNWDKFEPGSTDYYMNIQGKVGFGFECGFLGDPKTQETAEKAIINFLIFSGAISGKIKFRENQRILKITGIYKNKQGCFKRDKYFPDFKKLTEKTLIGTDGNIKIYANAGDVLLFVRNAEKIGEECFLTAKESIIKQEELVRT